ncbi:hypothetical protein SEA_VALENTINIPUFF_62 [Microbacterium phage ValentiniPuff]|uniref:Uncharacterized protein n=1 Tax=Microbacterium phage ValentiniPuff TaxID=2315705 RepID=A0A386KP32_9CAUD|nr:hypothetical protein SEA_VALENTINIPUFF_62 [Microbacterium phage ValentiniPuff]
MSSTPDPLQQPLTKDEILLAFDSAVGVLMSMRTLIDRGMLSTDVIYAMAPGACRHANRAPSDPSFCLDCEQEVGVSAGFTGGDGS